MSFSRAIFGAARRAAGLAALLWLGQGGGAAYAQAKAPVEGGFAESQGADAPINDKAFDCAAFRQLIAAAPDRFKAIRGPVKSDSETVTTYATAAPLLGTCEIVDKKKIGETIYSCQAGKLQIADMKATADTCLGDKAFPSAANENPQTQFLKYEPRTGDARARVVMLTTFGKTTLAIMNTR